MSGRYLEWTPRDRNFKEKLMASASIPVVFPFVDLKDEKDVLVDGGVRNITPLGGAFKSGADEVYVLLTSRVIRTDSELPESAVQENSYSQWDDNWLGTKVCGLDVLKRTVDILTDEIYLDDIRGAIDWNEVAQAISEVAAASKTGSLPVALAQAVEKLARSLEEARKRYVPVYVLAPREWYGEKNESTDFSPELIRKAVGHGQEVASDPSLWVWPPE